MLIAIDVLPDGARPFDVVGLGENSLDLVAVVDTYPPRNSKAPIRQLRQLPGGQVATAMVALSRLGWRARYMGRFGADEYGRIGLDSLVREGVDVSFAQQVPEATSHFSLVLVDEERGDRTVLWHHHPALSFPADAVPVDAVQSGRVLYVDATDPQAAARAVSIARASAMVTVADVEEVGAGVEALLEQVDVIIAAEPFARTLTGRGSAGSALEALAARFQSAAVVCITLGEEGSLARSKGQEIRTPSFRVTCVDSTGAGDAFRAGFIAAWLQEGRDAQLEEVLRMANATAALNCRAHGARTALPTKDEVKAVLETGRV